MTISDEFWPPETDVAAAIPVQQLIYARLLEHCESLSLPGLWSRYRDEDAFNAPPDIAATLDALRREFALDDLVQAGVVTADGAKVSPAAAIADPAAILIALRPRQGDQPTDILTPYGSIAGHAPLVSAMDDWLAFERSHDARAREIHIVPTMWDVAALRALRLCAAPMSGVATVSQDRLDALFRRWNSVDTRSAARSERNEKTGSQDSATSTIGRQDFFLFVQPWSLIEIDASLPSAAAQEYAREETERIRAHFTNIRKHLGRELPRAFVCSPAADASERLCFALRHGTRDDFYQVLDQTCLKGSAALVPLATGINKVFSPPADHATAASQLRESFSWRADKVARRQARQNWEETLDREMLAPLRTAALAEQDPVRANARMALAEQARLVHQGQAILGDKLSAAIDQSVEGGATTSIPIADIESLVKLSDKFLKLVNQVGQWPKPRSTKAPPGGSKPEV